MASEAKSLKLVVVTPEKAVLEGTAEMVVLPMFDGELGVLPGRAAMVGQLGPGELRFKNGEHYDRYFIDGGFVQVRSDAVTVLTATAKKTGDIKPEEITKEQEKVDALPAANAAERATKDRARRRVDGMRRVTSKTAKAH